MRRLTGWVRLLLWLAAVLLIAGALGWSPPGVADRWWLAGLLAAVVALGLADRWLRRRLPRRTILEIDLEGGVVEKAPRRLLRLGGPATPELRDVVEALQAAGEDRRIVALFVRLGPSGMGLAHAQELAAAVRDFRATGRRAVAWCSTLGEGHNATAECLLATAFDEVHVQPGGEVGLIGLALQQPFARGLLDKLGILPRIDAREEHKTARYPLTEHEMPEAARQSLLAVLESQAGRVCRQIAEQRGLDEAAVRRAMDAAPLSAEEALAAKLIDRLSHRDEVEDRIKKRSKGTPVALDRYLAVARRPYRRGPHVALIHGVGTIRRGRGERRLMPHVFMNAEEVVGAFRAAVDSSKVKAIVFRISSPGGSANASETIWREVERARGKGKPVVVSMGNLAGSGGYYIAAAADRILAQPGTITGSIGVVAGKLVTRDAWRKLGVNWRSVHVGDNALIWNSREDFTDAGWAKLRRTLDETYDLFMRRVAEGRSMTPERVRDAAQGRLWTGEAAKERGLVDELGGLRRAVEVAKELAGIPARAGVRLVTLPRPSSWWPRLGPPPLNERAAAIQELAERVEAVAAMVERLEPAEMDTLRMPWWFGVDG